ncbi:uncharacterized protein LOC127862912 [Dreissena polymorpha]|nr:uncharacterized protein LOC127862912 [Dreissena polymorpha]
MSAQFPECSSLLNDVIEIQDIIGSMKREQQEQNVTMRPSYDGSQRMGRPRFHIPKEQLELLLELRFTDADIANMIGVSISVIKRRLREYGLGRQNQYTTISNEDLDTHVLRLTHGNPLLGQRNVQGLLSSEGLVVQRSRVAESLTRVDGAAVAMRWSRTIQRRSYSVPGPNALWHIDGNHKFIRWGMVIHGGIDGFSRLVVFLRMSTNNRAETVMDCFTEATANYGIPSRVRCDHGGENKDVALFMNSHHGESRGSCITGKSVHNQRIERFWRDLYTGCSFRFKDLFHKLEEEGVLDLNSGVHLWSLHYIFLPRINRSLDQFVQGWNNHRLSSERGKTPNQLFVQGVIQNRGSNQTGVSEILHEPDMTEYYGVDWDGPVPQEDGEVEVSGLPCPVSNERLLQLKRTIDPLGHSEDGFGVDLYRRTVDFCNEIVE